MFPEGSANMTCTTRAEMHQIALCGMHPVNVRACVRVCGYVFVVIFVALCVLV